MFACTQMQFLILHFIFRWLLQCLQNALFLFCWIWCISAVPLALRNYAIKFHIWIPIMLRAIFALSYDFEKTKFFRRKVLLKNFTSFAMQHRVADRTWEVLKEETAAIINETENMCRNIDAWKVCQKHKQKYRKQICE